MVSEQRSIEKLIEKDESYAKQAISALESFAKRVDNGAAAAELSLKKDTESLAVVKRALRIESGKDFVTEYITKAGGKKSIESLKEEVRLRLLRGEEFNEKTTVTIRGTEMEIDDAVDRGVKLLLFDGLQEFRSSQDSRAKLRSPSEKRRSLFIMRLRKNSLLC